MSLLRSLENSPTHELQRCHAAGAKGRAGSPLPAAAPERTRSELRWPSARTGAHGVTRPTINRPDARLGVRGQAQRDPALGAAYINAQPFVPGESAVAARLRPSSRLRLARLSVSPLGRKATNGNLPATKWLGVGGNMSCRTARWNHPRNIQRPFRTQ
jgi:hypothetical protein